MTSSSNKQEKECVPYPLQLIWVECDGNAESLQINIKLDLDQISEAFNVNMWNLEFMQQLVSGNNSWTRT